MKRFAVSPKIWIVASALFAGAACSGGSTMPTPDGGDAGIDAGFDAGSDGGQTGLSAGEACLYDAQCASQSCGANGHGNCCAFACDTRDPVCGATACNEDGACTYPDSGLGCAPSRCENGQVASSTCDGQGTCAVSVKACPLNLLCAVDSGACPSNCEQSTDCLPGFTCSAGACVPLKAVGPCASGADCQSGQCLLAQSADGGQRSDGGTCCASACETGDPTCGAQACDPGTGACVYPVATSNCLTACASSKLTAGTCEGPNHTCTERSTLECPGLTVCEDETSCKKGCATAADCDQTIYPNGTPLVPNPNFCEPQSHECCPMIPGFAGGGNEGFHPLYGGVYNNVTVDPVAGSDFGCCGQNGNPPCRTIDRVLQLYPIQLQITNTEGPLAPSDSLLSGSNITLTVAGGSDWPADSGWPLIVDATAGSLSLSAPTPLYFNPPPEWDGGPEGAAIKLISRNQQNGSVHLQGLVIGSDSQGVQHQSAAIGLDNGAFPADGLDGGPDAGVLYNVANVVLDQLWINGREVALRAGSGSNFAFRLPTLIGAGSIIEFWNSNQFGSFSGIFSGFQPPIAPTGKVGLECRGATIAPYSTGSFDELDIDGQSVADIDAYDGCVVTWFTSIALGSQVADYGVGTCSRGKPDGTGIRATGTANVLINGSTNSSGYCISYNPNPTAMRCFSQFGVFQQASDAGTPTVELDDVVISNAGCAGAYVGAGQLIVNNYEASCLSNGSPPGRGSAFNDDFVGVWIPDGGGTVNMSLGPTDYPNAASNSSANPYNAFSCETAQEQTNCPAGLAPPPVGVGILNLSNQTAVIQDGWWSQWDGTTTQYWSCTDTTFTHCSCNGPGCDAGVGALPANADQGAGPDAVALNSNSAPFDFSGGLLSAEPVCR